MQSKERHDGFSFSFGNSIETLKSLIQKQAQGNARTCPNLHALSDTPKFAKVKETFRSSRKPKLVTKKPSEESLQRKSSSTPRSNSGIVVAVSGNKSPIHKIEINYNHWHHKNTPLGMTQRPKSMTSRVFSRPKCFSEEKQILTPKVLSSNYFRFFKQESLPMQQQLPVFSKRKLFNRKTYFSKRLPTQHTSVLPTVQQRGRLDCRNHMSVQEI